MTAKGFSVLMVALMLKATGLSALMVALMVVGSNGRNQQSTLMRNDDFGGLAMKI